jgi:hypothetical protein
LSARRGSRCGRARRARGVTGLPPVRWVRRWRWWRAARPIATRHSPLAAVAVGFALAAGVFIGGPLTGGGANPARSFGPMLVAGEFGDFWLYILAPLVGGLIAAFAGDFLLKAFSPEEDGDNGGDAVDDAAESRIAARTRLPGSRAAGLS